MTAGAERDARVGTEVQLRRFPYPYRSMLAICSDLDGTPDRHVYAEIMRFLNTTETTAMGPGVGLEVGNSIHFRAKPQRFSYWDTDEAGRAMVRTLICSGHIDCLHSFGERVYTREDAQRALEELQKHECRLKIWVDHGGAATNFGSDIMDGHGDEVGHPAYHADLTTDYGVEFVCCGRVTSVIGQDIPARLRGIASWSHPVVSSRTLLKEAVKQGLARAGSARYTMHRANETLRPRRLRDERPVYEFMRCNPHWGGISRGDQGRSIGEVLTADVLNCLIRRQGTCILYTHLGRVDDPRVPFNVAAVTAFRHLAQEFHAGRILVATTRRLLGYGRAVREIAYASRWEGEILRIDIQMRTPRNWVGALDAGDSSGLTFYVPDPTATRVTIDGQEAGNLRANPPDHTGRPSVSLPWPHLEFPPI
jgi:hypothetical protein